MGDCEILLRAVFCFLLHEVVYVALYTRAVYSLIAACIACRNSPSESPRTTEPITSRIGGAKLASLAMSFLTVLSASLANCR